MMEKADKTTSELFTRLFKASDLKDFIVQNEETMCVPPFHEYIAGLCREAGDTQEKIIKRSAIERTYGHQLFNGTRNPSRDKAIQLAFGFGLSIDKTQELIKIARKSPLYPKIKRDAAIIYCINRRAGIIETQALLHDLGLGLLGEE
jgi:transcriptional regulator with XRE-family HTH domain